MEMKNITVWLIIARSNLHVGNENVTNYGLIDKAIQRDSLTDLPCINSSSLKGAINEYVAQENKLDGAVRKGIFGSDKLDKKSLKQKGGCIFFDANILFLPVQDDKELYKLATCETVLDDFINKLSLFSENKEQNSWDKNSLIEKVRSKLTICLPLSKVPQPVSIKRDFSIGEFKELCNDEGLPIIARNCLENGESTNLWYEQVLPQGTVLGTFILSADNKLEEAIQNQMIQIGANATIGYGYCEFVKL